MDSGYCVTVKQESKAVYDGLGMLDDSTESPISGEQYYVPNDYEPGNQDNGNDSDTSSTFDRDVHEYNDDLFKYDEESDSEDDASTVMPQDATNAKHLKWTKQLTSRTTIKPFEAPAEAGGRTSGAPLDFFHQFFPEELYQVTQTETNNFAEFYQEKRRDLGRDWWEWSDTKWRPIESKQEIRTFLGICIAMAVHSLPNPRDYWSAQKNIGNRLIRRSSISMGRFDRIMHYFYLSNPWRDPEMIANLERRVEACNRDPLYKVSRLLHEHVKNTSVAVRQPQQDMVLQELTGSLQKTNGWKVVALKDAATGYVSNFTWYHDPKMAHKDRNISTTQEIAATSLIKTLSGKGHRLYADGLYISPTTACQFTKIDTYVTTNHSSWPREIARSSLKLEVGQIVSVQHNRITATAWQGKRVKRCLSTMHDGLTHPVTLTLCDPATRERTIKEVSCPTPIANHMAVLNELPQRHLLLLQAPILQKLTNSWWKRLVWLLIDICINNAYVLWTASKGPQLSYSEFAMELASSLITESRQDHHQEVDPPSVMVPTGPELLDSQTSIHDVHQQHPTTSYSSQPVSRQPVYPAIHRNPSFQGAIVQTVAPPDLSAADHQTGEAGPEATQHCLVRFPGRGRNCRQCIDEKKRTRCGRRKDTQFGCLACGLNLCRLDCFLKFHRSRGLKVPAVPMAKIKRINRQPPPFKRRKLNSGWKL